MISWKKKTSTISKKKQNLSSKIQIDHEMSIETIRKLFVQKMKTSYEYMKKKTVRIDDQNYDFEKKNWWLQICIAKKTTFADDNHEKISIVSTISFVSTIEKKNYRFVLKKNRRLQTMYNEKSIHRTQSFRNDFFRRNHDRRNKSAFRNRYQKSESENRYKKSKSRFWFRFNHRSDKFRNYFKRKLKSKSKSKSRFHKSNKSKIRFRRQFWFRFKRRYEKYRSKSDFKNRYVKKKRNHKKFEFYHRFSNFHVKSVKLKFTKIMKFDFEITFVVFFVRKFNQIIEIEKSEVVFRILSMCLKKTALKWHTNLFAKKKKWMTIFEYEKTNCCVNIDLIVLFCEKKLKNSFIDSMIV